MASQSENAELLKKLYELNNLYKSKDKKKKKKHKKKTLPINTTNGLGAEQAENVIEENVIPGEIQYVYSHLELDHHDPNYEYFNKIFEKFKPTDPQFVESSSNKTNEILKKLKPMFPDLPDEEDKPEEKVSKRKLKEKLRMPTAELKLRVQRPEVVEMHDANSKEPVLLIHLKSYRNSVPVPKHWSYKRKYLQGKRGFVKPPFELPDYIKATGIMELRSAYHDRENARDLRTKMRNKIRPKLGRTDIDYQKLHDAFFKYQTKPKMTMHGDLYYEGKEFEVKLKQKKPGNITDELRIALGMPVGMNKHLVPPPWLIAMQRYGPPPSYPNLKIHGLNAPIPEGATFGYHAGGWGKPPVDELGRPLYGDVFGTNLPPEETYEDEIEVDKSLWGETEVEIAASSESDQEMEDITTPNEIAEPITAITTYSDNANLISSFTIPEEIDNADYLELRKKKSENKSEPLYSVLPSKKTDTSSLLVASSHTYDINNKIDHEDHDDIQDVEMEVENEPVIEAPKKGKHEAHKESSKTKKKDDSKSSKKNKDFKF